MNDGYGKAVLGYFGRPPLPPDPDVVKIAAEQLDKPPFDGDPLEAAPDSLAAARAALTERGLATTDENVFLVASAIVAGKNIDLDEGIRLLTGKAKIVLRQKEGGGCRPDGSGTGRGNRGRTVDRPGDHQVHRGGERE